jgi:predicted nucleotidyltransferase
MEIDQQNITIIKKLCKKYSVKTLSAFGSVVKGDFNSESDIDFAVDFNENDPIKYSDLYYGLKEKLEHLLGRKIDLIELRGIKNKFFIKELDATKVLIYGQ